MIGSEHLWPGRVHERRHISTRQYARLVREWFTSIGLEPKSYRTLIDTSATTNAVIAVDLQGHGASPVTPDGSTFRGIADAIADFIHAEDVIGPIAPVNRLASGLRWKWHVAALAAQRSRWRRAGSGPPANANS